VTSYQPDEFDSPWKEALERYFSAFLAFFFPQAHDDIDWSRGYEFLDKELQQVARDAELGRRLVDKLVRVWRKPGEETWVLVHIEIQGQRDPEFARRMYVYNYRLFDRYARKVASLGVLADEQPGWRPQAFGYEMWGCEVGIRFPIVKLLDLADRLDELEESANPFAVVALAHLQTLATHDEPERRLEWKLRIVRGLYRRGYGREDVLELFRVIDWIMGLPEELIERFDDSLDELEREIQMPYITSIERKGIARGREEGLALGRKEGLEEGRQEGRQEGLVLGLRDAAVAVLEARFDQVPAEIRSRIEGASDVEALKALHRRAATAATLEEFRQALGDPA
jgi:hypothetical protein